MHIAFSLPVFIATAFTLSVFSGILGAILGLGGGSFIIPLLTLVLHLDIQYAIGASAVGIIATSSGAAVAYLKDRLTNLRIGMALEVGTTVGSIAGAFLSGYVSPKWIYITFGMVLLYSASTMLKVRNDEVSKVGTPDALSKRLQLNGSYYDQALGQTVEYQATNTILGLAVMYVAGALGGLLGIGAGAFKVLGMDQVMKLPIKVSSATSNFMIGVTAAASAAVYFSRGQVNPEVAAPVALGVLLGALIGAKMMVRLRDRTIRTLLIPILIWIAVTMIFKGWHLK